MHTDDLARYNIRINGANQFESYKQGVWRPPSELVDYDLLVILFGTATCTLNGRQHTLTQNDVLLLRPGDRIVNPLAAGRLANWWVHFDFLDPDGQPCSPPGHILPPRLPASVNSLVVNHMVQELVRAHLDEARATSQTVLMSLLLMLSRVGEIRSRDFSVEHRNRLFREIAARIIEHPAQQRTVSELAQEAGMSQVHFSRLFKEFLGSTPGDFMIDARIERAKHLLVTTSQDIWPIADSLGYRDIYFFTHQFKKRAGLPPAAYRKKHTWGK